MLPYFFSFGFSVLFCFLGEFLKKKNKTVASGCAYIISVLIVSIFAAIRDLHIGTDVHTYAIPLFEKALCYSDFFSYYYDYIESIEVLYLLLTYVVSCFTDNIHVLLFFIAIIIYGLTLDSLRKSSQYISVWMAWLSFLTLFYGNTLNLLRQSLAMSIMFWGFHYLIQNKDFKFLFFMLVSFNFHKSAILFLIVYILHKILQKENAISIDLLIVFIITIGMICYGSLLNLFINIGVLPEKFYRYVGEGISFILNPVIVRLPFILLSILFYRKFVAINRPTGINDKSEGRLYLLLLFIDLISVQLRSISSDLVRISYWFGMYSPVVQARIYKISENKVIMGTFLVTFFAFLWIYQNVVQGNNEIYPYSSAIIGL